MLAHREERKLQRCLILQTLPQSLKARAVLPWSKSERESDSDYDDESES